MKLQTSYATVAIVLAILGIGVYFATSKVQPVSGSLVEVTRVDEAGALSEGESNSPRAAASKSLPKERVNNEPPPIVKVVDGSDEHTEWATMAFIVPSQDFGYEKFAFIEIDYHLLLKRIKENPIYLASAAGKEPGQSVLADGADFELQFFEENYPLRITGVKLRQVAGMNYISVHGKYDIADDTRYTDIPGPYSWTLNINESENVTIGYLKNSKHRIIIQYTPDMLATVAAIVSNEELKKFPAID